MLGTDLAAQVTDQKDADARRLAHPFDTGWALTWGAYVFNYLASPSGNSRTQQKPIDSRGSRAFRFSTTGSSRWDRGSRSCAWRLGGVDFVVAPWHGRVERVGRPPQWSLHQGGSGGRAGAAG